MMVISDLFLFPCFNQSYEHQSTKFFSILYRQHRTKMLAGYCKRLPFVRYEMSLFCSPDSCSYI